MQYSCDCVTKNTFYDNMLFVMFMSAECDSSEISVFIKITHVVVDYTLL